MMSNVRRFNLPFAQPGDLQDAPDGAFVMAEAYLALLAQNEALIERNAVLEQQAQHNYEFTQAALQELYLVRAVLHPGGPERDAFEVAYAAEQAEASGRPVTAVDIAKLRVGDGYGEPRDYLEGRWHGWQARSNAVPEVGLKAIQSAQERAVAARALLEASQPASQRRLFDFFACCKRIAVELADSPKSALSRLQQAVDDTEAQQSSAVGS